MAVSTSDANIITRNHSFSSKIPIAFSNIDVVAKEKTDSLEGLKMASDYMQDNCSSEFEHCVLLVFSNLNDFREDWQSPSIDKKVNLEGIDVIPILYNCRYLDGECETKVNNWTRHFNYFNAKSITFLLNDSDILKQMELSFIQLTEDEE